MADEVIRGLIEIRDRASKKVRQLRRELETLGGKTAVKTQNEIKKLERDIGRLGGSTKKTTPIISRFTQGIAAGNLIAMGTAKAMSFLSDAISGLGSATLLAARVDVLNRVIRFTGQNAGYSAIEIGNIRDSIIDLGITERHALEIMQRFNQAQLDLSGATKIARMAQDAATIAGVNSSEAALQMTDAVNKLFPRLLKQFGIMVDLNTVYAKASKTLGKSVDSLTAMERKQALLNATLEQGKVIAGVYETAMLEPGKRLTSLARHAENAAVSIGQHFTPVLGAGVDALTMFLQGVEDVGNALAGPDVLKTSEWIGDFRGELHLLNAEVADNLGIFKAYSDELEGLAKLREEADVGIFKDTKWAPDEEDTRKLTLFKNELSGVFAVDLTGPGIMLKGLFEQIDAIEEAYFGAAAGLVDWTGKITESGPALDEQNVRLRQTKENLDAVKSALGEFIEIKPPTQEWIDIMPDPELLEMPEIRFPPDLVEIDSTFVEKFNEELRIVGAEAEYARFQVELMGDTGEDAGESMTYAFDQAASSISSMINMMKSGTFTFGGFLRAMSMIPGLGAFAAPLSVLGSILPFDDPVNDSALIRETRRIGTFLSKGFAQSAFKPQPQPATINVTINAAGMSPDEIFDQLARLQRTGFIQE